MKNNIPEFNEIKISTKTIIGVSNLNFDLELLHTYLPITPYVVIPKKRGRKKKIEFVDPNIDVPEGSIVSINNGKSVRGVIIKLKKKSSKTFFLNSITLVIVLAKGKLINIKITHNGKFQITGCKESSHYIDSIRHIYDYLKHIELQIGESICFLKESHTTPKVLFNVVMKNIDFKIGFKIQRDQFNNFIYQKTNYKSIFEGNVNTGVNVKIRTKNPYEEKLICLELLEHGDKQYLVPYEDYLDLLTKEERKKLDKKIKYHTFLVFHSGSIIQSGSGPEMPIVFKEFINVLLDNRNVFEEKLNKD